MRKLFNLKQKDIGIDLGTVNTLVYRDKEGVVIDEPSVVAIDINNGEIVAVGKTAFEMIGKTPGNIIAMRPLEEGVISDYEITQTMLKYFFDKASKEYSILSARVVVAIPSGITDVERRAVEDAVFQAGAREVLLIEEALVSAIGAGLPVFKAKGSMILNVGGGTTEIAVVSLGGIVSSKSVFVGGDKFNEDIISLIKDEYQLMIGHRTAEEIKLKIGTVNFDKEEVKLEISGRDAFSGLPDRRIISSSLITQKLEEDISEIVDGIRAVLERTPPELSRDILKDGIMITGGSSKLDGLVEELEKRVGIRIKLDNNPLQSASIGTGEIIKRFDQIKKSRKQSR